MKSTNDGSSCEQELQLRTLSFNFNGYEIQVRGVQDNWTFEKVSEIVKQKLKSPNIYKEIKGESEIDATKLERWKIQVEETCALEFIDYNTDNGSALIDQKERVLPHDCNNI